MSTSYELRLARASARTLEVCKFQQPVSGLESTSGRGVRVERTLPTVSTAFNRKHTEEEFAITAGGRRYVGSRESVGADANASSQYVAIQIKHGVMTMTPLADWYFFRPEVQHATMSLEDAEASMSSKSKRAEIRERRLANMTKKEEDDEEDEDGKRGGRKRSALGGGGGRGVKFDPDADDEFDDGAGPDWAAGEMRDEDGNEGLDMMDEELFEDDEDESFEATKRRDLQYGIVMADEEELSFNTGMEEMRASELERAERGYRERAEAAEERGESPGGGGSGGAGDDPFDDDDDDDDDGAVGGAAWRRQQSNSEWATRMKQDLKAAKKQRREEMGDDSSDEYGDDDDDDDDRYGAPAIIKRDPADEPDAAAPPAAGGDGGAGAAATKGSPSTAAAVKVEAGAAPPVAGTKRALSPGGGGGGASSSEAAKRAKQQQQQQHMASVAASAAALGGAGGGVTERDIVDLLHKEKRMHAKAMLTAFKPLLKSKADKSAFMEMMRRLCYFQEIEETDPATGAKTKVNVLTLKQATLVEYGLHDD